MNWEDGTWTIAPVTVRHDGRDLIATAAKGSDAWRETAHGYVTDSAHALLAPMASGTAVEVSFRADLTQQFDQAGLMLRADAANWVKANLEFADGHLQLGAVVTRGESDWSTAVADGWAGREVTFRASRFGNAVRIEAKVDDEAFVAIRLAWFAPSVEFAAGPFLAAPTRDRLGVRFTRWVVGPANEDVHPGGLPDDF
jgi:uncharacterized protein